MKIVPGGLDFTVATREGRVGFFDAKSFNSDKVKFSELRPHQIDRAKLYNEWNIPAGFVIFLRVTKFVFFYSGLQVSRFQGRSLSPADGLLLGRWDQFSPAKLFEKKGAPVLPSGTPSGGE